MVTARGRVTQQITGDEAEMLEEVKKDSISYGKDPKALATTVLYRACLTEQEGDNNHISLARIARAGGISIVTLRKRVSDVLEALQ